MNAKHDGTSDVQMAMNTQTARSLVDVKTAARRALLPVTETRGQSHLVESLDMSFPVAGSPRQRQI